MNRFTTPPRQHNTPKPFTWSYSKLKNFEACPQKHLKVDLEKAVEEEKSDALDYGNLVHDRMAAAIGKGEPLPPGLKDQFQKWVDKLTLKRNPDELIQVELKLAITRDFKPTGWFDRNVWLRVVIDYLKLVPASRGLLALMVDYKTGKMLDDPIQLAIFAQVVFSYYPDVVAIRTDYLWTQDDCTTKENFVPADMVQLWTVLNPRVAALEQAWLTGQYPANKSGLCKKHCPVLTCQHNGRRS